MAPLSLSTVVSWHRWHRCPQTESALVPVFTSSCQFSWSCHEKPAKPLKPDHLRFSISSASPGRVSGSLGLCLRCHSDAAIVAMRSPTERNYDSSVCDGRVVTTQTDKSHVRPEDYHDKYGHNAGASLECRTTRLSNSPRQASYL